MLEAPKKKINILLVDDNPANLVALAAILDEPEYHLDLAPSGKEALACARQNSYGVILLDVQMPEMDGFETARRLRAIPNAKDVPVIFVTAIYRETKFVHDGYAAGGVDYLFKPLDPEVVRSKVAVFAELYRKKQDLHLQNDRMARLVAVQRITTEVLARCDGADQAIPECLREICKALNWDMGTFWALDGKKSRLICKHVWADPTCPSGFLATNGFGGFDVFEGFQPGIGLPGRVWMGGRAIWSREGMGSAAAFPIEVHGELEGVMEFFSREPQEEDPNLLNILSALGSQIGQFIGRVSALRLAQNAVRVRDEFLSIASHELRTPLTALKLQAEFNQRKLMKNGALPLEPSPFSKFIKITSSQVSRLIDLVENMLDVSRITNGKLSIDCKETDLGEVVARVADIFSDQADPETCRFALRIEHGVVGHWDPFRIEQVVTNLLTNALKYGGSARPVEISVSSGSQRARIEVKDYGPGIAPENLERIFGRFERAVGREKISGLGLGLYISHQIVEAHQGSIRVESELGQGSTFIVELPLEPVEKVSLPASRDLGRGL